MNLYISSSLWWRGNADFAIPRFWLGFLPPFLAAFISSSKALEPVGFSWLTKDVRSFKTRTDFLVREYHVESDIMPLYQWLILNIHSPQFSDQTVAHSGGLSRVAMRKKPLPHCQHQLVKVTVQMCIFLLVEMVRSTNW